MTLEEAFYESRFEVEFLRSKAAAFQAFFERLMGYAHREDFMACRPWGNRGDRKNDGFLKSQRRLFQVYGPNEMTEADAIAKITEDFDGARTHWGTHFDKWSFVHNADAGLPPHVMKLLLDFEVANPGKKLDPWSLEELRTVFRTLTIEDKRYWFGFVPTEETKARLGFAELQVVLEALAGRSLPRSEPVRDVPMGKIEANALSESSATMLKQGMAKAPLVEAFFAQFYDETLGVRIADAFRSQYRLLRETLTPNRIFAGLQIWAGGDQRGSPEHEMAVLTIIAYYFERCDIFEEPRQPSS